MYVILREEFVVVLGRRENRRGGEIANAKG
jgi:hypothetical protein